MFGATERKLRFMSDGELILQKIRLEEEPAQGSYLRGIPAIKHLIRERELSFSAPVTFFVGENGSGKSTLTEAIAVCCGFNAEGGTKNFCFSTSATHSELWRCLGAVRGPRRENGGFFLRAESFYNVASDIDELDALPAASRKISESYGGGSLHARSHGESFMTLVETRFSDGGLYILDEPEAALSPSRLLSLLLEIKRLVGTGAQFIIATHSPMLMTFPGSEVLLFSGSGIARTDYRRTEHFALTRRFLSDPERFYAELFAEDKP